MLNALQQEIRSAAANHALQVGNANKCAFKRIPVPPDGLCAYHCIVGSLTYPTWSKVSRTSLGFAVNLRQQKAESDVVKRLRGHALLATPESDPIIAEQALIAQQSLSVDIGELSWLGQSLGISIRCSVEEQVGGYKKNTVASRFTTAQYGLVNCIF